MGTFLHPARNSIDESGQNVLSGEYVLPSRTNQEDASGLSQRLSVVSEKERKMAQMVGVLGELHDLLEAYASLWYTQEQHERTESALRPSSIHPPVVAAPA